MIHCNGDEYREISFYIPSLMKSNLDLERKKLLYLSSMIRIIWSDSI